MRRIRKTLLIVSAILLSVIMVLGLVYFWLYGVSIMKAMNEGSDILTLIKTNPNFLCMLVFLGTLLLISIIFIFVALIPLTIKIHKEGQ